MDKQSQKILRLLVKHAALKAEEIDKELGTCNAKHILQMLEKQNMVKQSFFGYSLTTVGANNLPVQYTKEPVQANLINSFIPRTGFSPRSRTLSN